MAKAEVSSSLRVVLGMVQAALICNARVCYNEVSPELWTSDRGTAVVQEAVGRHRRVFISTVGASAPRLSTGR